MFGALLGLGIFMLPMILLVTFVTVKIYKFAFDRHTTKVLQEGNAGKRKWIAPWGLAIILLVIQLVLAGGCMFLLSSYMYDTQASSPLVSEDGEPMPIVIYTNNRREFTHKFDGFKTVGQDANDGFSCNVYKKINKDNTVTYCFSGKINKWQPGDNFELTCYDEKGDTTASSFMGSGNENEQNLFYEIRVSEDEYRPGTVYIKFTKAFRDPAEPNNSGVYEIKLDF